MGLVAWTIMTMGPSITARADDDATADPGPAAEGDPGEIIEITSAPLPAAGAIAVEAEVARATAGALGEPFRALALLPGVTTSIAASGYPIIRGTLPGESRFELDGIEIPMLYHLLLGNQVIHPAFLGELSLRAGGADAEHGHLLGGLVSITPASTDHARTELEASLVELGAFRAQPLSSATSIAVAARVGTLSAVAKLYDADAAIAYVDQQTRLVHRLGNGDELTLTSLGAYDYVREPPNPDVRTIRFGFHRLDGRWTHRADGRRLRAGLQTQLDTLGSVIKLALPDPGLQQPGAPALSPTPARHEGGWSYGLRAYADASQRITSWLTARGGGEANQRTLINRTALFSLTDAADPFLGVARSVDSEGAWLALDLRAGPVTITPSVRADSYHADLAAAAPVRHDQVDPRLTIAAELPSGGRAELAGGVYSAPPQVSVIESSIAIGPLLTTEGTASLAGISRGYQGQASIQAPLGHGLEGSLAAYYRDTTYAVDFAMLDKPFTRRTLCEPYAPTTLVYRHIETRAMGLEAMVRGTLGRNVTGWVSYSLGKIDRDLGFVTLPHDYDQRHTLTATAQWRHGAWRFGASGNVHTGRPAVYPELGSCESYSGPYIDDLSEPTHLRRLPTTWRVDLRAERAFELSGWHLRVYFEMQNAFLTQEVTGYRIASDYSHVEPATLFLPVPLLGVAVEL